MDGPSTSSAAATAPKAKPPRVAGSKEDIFGTETGKSRKYVLDIRRKFTFNIRLFDELFFVFSCVLQKDGGRLLYLS